MKPIASLCTAITLSLSLTSAAHASMIITPAGTGAATGSDNVDFADMFDSQPASVPTEGPTTDSFGGSYGFFSIANTGRVGYIDFGTDFADITIEEAYIGVQRYGDNSTATMTYWWSDTTDMTFDGTDIAQSSLNLFNTDGAPSGGDYTAYWFQSFSGSAPVQKQYLVIEYTTAGANGYGNRLNELVLAGSIAAVPEPATSALLIGAFALILLRRRRQC